MTVLFDGTVSKMKVEYADPVRYFLGDVVLNDFIGIELQLVSKVEKLCIYCGRSIKKTFGQGYCFPCFQTLARCDLCILRPEKCHYAKGTCREPEWGEENCLIEHTVYLANTSGVKVGITRSHQQTTRWIDQGALAAIVLGTVPGRLESGIVEVALKAEFADKTNWRALLTGKKTEVDLEEHKASIMEKYPDLFSDQGGEYAEESEAIEINYPVLNYLDKAKSGNLDKIPEIRGILNGIRGQYLLIGEVGINVRKYQGYIWQLKTC